MRLIKLASRLLLLMAGTLLSSFPVFAGELEGRLLDAVNQGQAGEVKRLLDQGADVNSTDKDNGATVLLLASFYGNSDIAKLLIEKGADVNAKGNGGVTALMGAAYHGFVEIARLLVDKGADVQAKSNKGETALMLAEKNWHIGVIEIIDPALGKKLLKEQKWLNAKLMEVAKTGQIDEVKRLLGQGADVNTQIIEGQTALSNALLSSHEEIAKLLIARGADINIANPLYYMASWGVIANVKLLIDKGANVNARTKDGATALMGAALNGHTDIVKLLIDKGANVNVIKSNNGGTALTRAAMYGRTETAKLLIDKGANVNDGSLLYASQNGFAEIARLLVDKGADVNIKNAKGETALELAQRNGHTAVIEAIDPTRRKKALNDALIEATEKGQADEVKKLLDQGADANAQWIKRAFGPPFTKPVLLIAAEKGHTEIAKLLINKGAYVHGRDNFGETVLMHAAKNGHLEMVKLLVKEGADVNASPAGMTLMLAEQNGHIEVAKYLRSKGAK